MEITLKVLFPRQIFDLATNFQRKFDNDHCNDVEKQSNFKKFDCLKADLSAFVETLSVSTFYNHYNLRKGKFLWPKVFMTDIESVFAPNFVMVSLTRKLRRIKCWKRFCFTVFPVAILT